MNYIISLATDEDAEKISVLAKQSGELHQQKEPTVFKKCSSDNNADYIKKAINDEYAEVFKACDENNRIVGYLTLYLHDCPAEFFVYPDFGYIGDLCVDQNHRHQGIAQALIARAEEYLISKNIRAVELDVFTFNTPADQLYDKIGYKNLKYRKRKLL